MHIPESDNSYHLRYRKIERLVLTALKIKDPESGKDVIGKSFYTAAYQYKRRIETLLSGENVDPLDMEMDIGNMNISLAILQGIPAVILYTNQHAKTAFSAMTKTEQDKCLRSLDLAVSEVIKPLIEMRDQCQRMMPKYNLEINVKIPATTALSL